MSPIILWGLSDSNNLLNVPKGGVSSEKNLSIFENICYFLFLILLKVKLIILGLQFEDLESF